MIYYNFKFSGGSSYQSQKNLFHDFILRANKYGSLDIFGGDHYEKKLVLVEVSCSDFNNCIKSVPTKKKRKNEKTISYICTII